jgi:hypothetical protein
MRPGLKQLTPHEKKVVERMTRADRQRWTELLLLNKWKPCATSPRS